MSAGSAACCCPSAVRDLAATSLASALPDSDVKALVTHLYVCRELSTYQIGDVVGMNRQRVQRLLARAGVPVKSRGAGRSRRRRDAGQDALTDLMVRLYRDSGWTAAQVSALTGVRAGRRVAGAAYAGMPAACRSASRAGTKAASTTAIGAQAVSVRPLPRPPDGSHQSRPNRSGRGSGRDADADTFPPPFR
jgi:hypothetical protein